MVRLFRSLSCIIILAAIAGLACADSVALDYPRLQPAIDVLTSADQDAVADTIDLIKKGEHVLALSRISALKQRSPHNSSLRILASYVLLQAGNLAGAFDEAEKAHEAPDGDVYKCWFLGKIALLNGKKAVCERELEHLKHHRGMVAETAALEKELANN